MGRYTTGVDFSVMQRDKILISSVCLYLLIQVINIQVAVGNTNQCLYVIFELLCALLSSQI